MMVEGNGLAHLAWFLPAVTLLGQFALGNQRHCPALKVTPKEGAVWLWGSAKERGGTFLQERSMTCKARGLWTVSKSQRHQRIFPEKASLHINRNCQLQLLTGTILSYALCFSVAGAFNGLKKLSYVKLPLWGTAWEALTESLCWIIRAAQSKPR